jgi:hypothetical protein
MTSGRTMLNSSSKSPAPFLPLAPSPRSRNFHAGAFDGLSHGNGDRRHQIIAEASEAWMVGHLHRQQQVARRGAWHCFPLTSKSHFFPIFDAGWDFDFESFGAATAQDGHRRFSATDGDGKRDRDGRLNIATFGRPRRSVSSGPTTTSGELTENVLKPKPTGRWPGGTFIAEHFAKIESALAAGVGSPSRSTAHSFEVRA